MRPDPRITRTKIHFVFLVCFSTTAFLLLGFSNIIDTSILSSPVSPHIHLEYCCSPYFTPRLIFEPPPNTTCSSPRPVLDDEEYLHLTKDCAAFRHARGYNRFPITLEEQEFPLALSILMYKDVEQTERLLRAIYRPHNVYCIHVDAGAEPGVLQAMEAVMRCLDNVFMASRSLRMEYAFFPVLAAEVTCMDDLFKYSSVWKYFINLTGQDFPLRTNLELVQILSAYDGGNDIHGSHIKMNRNWTAFQYYNESHHNYQRKSPPPDGFVIHKGATHVAVSRAFVKAAVTRPSALRLLGWLRDAKVPDEMFFNTLNHNPDKAFPGAFLGDAETKPCLTRFKLWFSPIEACWGSWVRDVCHLDLGDLHRLVHAPHLFANKFSLNQSRLALDCVEHWYWRRALEGRGLEEIDLEYYRQMPWVKHHV